MSTLRETIRDTTKKHLENGGLFYAQCTQAVGWIGGTVPSDVPEGSIIELPTSDVSNGGVVVGAGLSGRRPIYTIRYQGFITYNGSSIFNYAAKSKEMWGVPCPIFVRGIGMEGSIGPVASNMHHSVAVRFPGIKVYAPLCPSEWKVCWEEFLKGTDPVYCSEYRKTYDYTDDSIEITPFIDRGSGYTILGIGYARIPAYDAAYATGMNFGRIHRLKPLEFDLEVENMIKNSTEVFVVDSDYEHCGCSEYVCCEIMKRFNNSITYKGKLNTPKCYPIGLANKTAGFSHLCDNLTPTTEEIIKFAERYI